MAVNLEAFQNAEMVTYKYSGKTIFGSIIKFKSKENKILVHFNNVSWTDPVDKYTWFNLPNSKISICVYKTTYLKKSNKIISLKPIPFTITIKPLYITSDDRNEFILFLENVRKKKKKFKNSKPKVALHQYDISKDEYIKTSHSWSIHEAKMQMDGEYIFNDSGKIKQIMDIKTMQIDNLLFENHEKDTNYGQGCYIPAPFDIMYFISQSGDHFVYDMTTKKINKIFGCKQKCDRLIYCKSLQRLLIINDKKILWMDMNKWKTLDYLPGNWVKYEAKEFNQYLNHNALSMVLGHVLLVFGSKQIYGLDLRDEKKYEGYFGTSDIGIYVVKYAILENSGMMHLFSDSQHVAVELDKILPPELQLAYVEVLIKRYVTMSVIEQLGKDFPVELCDLIERFYPFGAL